MIVAILRIYKVMGFVGVCWPSACLITLKFSWLQCEVAAADIDLGKISGAASVHDIFFKGKNVIAHETGAKHVGAYIKRILANTDMGIIEEIIRAATRVTVKGVEVP